MSHETRPADEPRRRDRARSEARLIEAAQHEFSVHGFKSATTRAIATRAGCSEGLIQNYFGGKEGLLMAVMRAGTVADALDGGFFERPRATDAETEVRELLTFMIEAMRRLAPRLRIQLERVLLDAAFARRFADETPRRALVAAIATRLRREWPASADPDRTAEAIVSVGFELGFVHPEILDRSSEAVEAQADHFATLLARALEGNLTN